MKFTSDVVASDLPQLDSRRLRIPRWRGFNLTEMVAPERCRPFLESDFAWLAELGFNFARLPLSYRCWTDPSDHSRTIEQPLRQLDRALALGRQYNIHVNLCLHRIPGYCVNGRDLEPYDLFSGPELDQARALDASVAQWQLLTDRYRGVPRDRLSFDLMNEPPFLADHTRYIEIIQRLTNAIREIDPDRLIVVDGADIGQTPVLGIADLGVIQSTRGYLPKALSHFKATWVPTEEFESFAEPTWPLTDGQDRLWDRERLRKELIEKWQPLMAQGIPIHVGEWGCFNRTPHPVMLGWMRDLLALWNEVGWGWAMWQFRGHFGILDSERPDVVYEDFHGHALDRRMLELLLET